MCRFKCHSLTRVSCKLADSEHSAPEPCLCIGGLGQYLCCSLWNGSCICVVMVQVVWKTGTWDWQLSHGTTPHVLLARGALPGFPPVCQLSLASTRKSSWAPVFTHATPQRTVCRKYLTVRCVLGTFSPILDGGWFALVCNISQTYKNF